MKFYGTVKDGKFLCTVKDALKQAFVELEGEKIEVAVKKFRLSKSDAQRKYYWGCILETLSDWNGDPKEWWHEYFKLIFLPIEINTPDGLKIVGRSTESLNTKECEEYHENIRRWAATREGVNIPLPNEEQYLASYGITYTREK